MAWIKEMHWNIDTTTPKLITFPYIHYSNSIDQMWDSAKPRKSLQRIIALPLPHCLSPPCLLVKVSPVVIGSTRWSYQNVDIPHCHTQPWVKGQPRGLCEKPRGIVGNTILSRTRNEPEFQWTWFVTTSVAAINAQRVLYCLYFGIFLDLLEIPHWSSDPRILEDLFTRL